MEDLTLEAWLNAAALIIIVVIGFWWFIKTIADETKREEQDR